MTVTRNARCAVVATVLAVAPLGTAAWAADPSRPEAASLAAREAELLDRYRELEMSFLRLADLLATTDPRRADALRAAFDRARQEQVGDRMAAIVAMLEQGQFLKAGTSQQDAVGRFRALLELLEAGAGEERATDAARAVRELVGRVSKLISRQREIEAATESGASADELAGRQRRVADDARTLGDDVQRVADRLGDGAKPRDPSAPAAAGSDGAEGRDADGPRDAAPGATPPAGSDPGAAEPPGAAELPGAAAEPDAAGDDDAARSRRTAARVRAAERRMQRALERLRDAETRAARAEQEKAVEELETARAELEEILRQMREEEVTRFLVQLEARLRGMLKAERGVLGDAERLATTVGPADRERQLEAARLGREQVAITAEAARALTLLRDDGSAVAIPQALEQVHDDSAQAATRLARGDVGSEALGLVGEIVTGLEELLAAVEKARQERRDDAAAGGGGHAAEAGEQPLVDKLAELKMLRSLQVRVNARTRRLARLLDAGDAAVDEPAVRAALVRLAERQRSIEDAARAIVAGLPE